MTGKIGTGLAWACASALLVLSASGLAAELAGGKEPSAGHACALARAVALESWRVEARIGMGLDPDLPPPQREAHLLAAIRLAPTDAMAWMALSSLRSSAGQDQQAARCRRQALRMDPLGAATRMRLARLALEAADLEGGLIHLREAVEISPDRRMAEALELAATVVTDPARLDSLVPPGARHRLAAARLLSARGLATAAELQFEQASRLDPETRAIHDSHVEFHLGRGEIPDAVRLIRGRLLRQPGDRDLRLQLAQLLIDLRHGPEALEEIEQAGRLFPADAGVADLRSLLELEMGDAARAREMARELVGRRPELASARVTLARALWIMGDRRGAARELAQAEALDARRADVQLLLARLNRELGNPREAAARYRRAIQMGYVSPAREELLGLPEPARSASGG